MNVRILCERVKQMCIRDSSIPLEDKDFHEELNTIKYIAKANGYKGSIVESLVKKHRKKKNNIELQENNRNKVRYIASEYGNTLPKICLLYSSRCV